LSLNLDYSGTLGEADDRYSGFISLLRAKDKSTSKLNLSYSANESSNTENLYTTWNYQYKLRDDLTGELNLNYKEYEKEESSLTRTLPTELLLRKLLTFTLITCDIVATQIWKETPTLVTPIKWYSNPRARGCSRQRENRRVRFYL